MSRIYEGYIHDTVNHTTVKNLSLNQRCRRTLRDAKLRIKKMKGRSICISRTAMYLKSCLETLQDIYICDIVFYNICFV